ncbi:MAG: ABC transporter permease [Alphaproteobacteria bacterium]
MALAVAIIAILLIGPIYRVLFVGLTDGETGSFTFANYVLIFLHKYYVGAIVNTLLIGTLGMLGACILGIPFAYFMARYKVRGQFLVSTLAVMALVSPPFFGAYAWIMLLGANGSVTLFLRDFGIDIPSIYGITGIVLVSSFKFVPFVYLITEAALKSINRSYEEAAENLGCSAFQRFFKITLPLVFPAVSSGAMMSFITAINELSSSLILYRGSTMTMPVRIYISVLDGEFGMAAALSTVLLFSTGICVYLVFHFSKSKEGAFI